jgi:hypothetical protein
LGDPVVGHHEVCVLSKLGIDLTRADPLGLPCYRGDRHEALLKSGVHPVGDFQSLVEVPDWESLSETSTTFIPLSIAVTPSVLVIGGLVRRRVGGHLIFLDIVNVPVGSSFRSLNVAGSHEDLTIRSAETIVSSRHLG